jgi:hypothetical protein
MITWTSRCQPLISDQVGQQVSASLISDHVGQQVSASLISDHVGQQVSASCYLAASMTQLLLDHRFIDFVESRSELETVVPIPAESGSIGGSSRYTQQHT